MPRPKWSSSRPGVAISTSTPRSSFLHLIVERHAADQQRQLQLVVDAVFLEALRHLGGQLARRRQDQRARHARPWRGPLEPGRSSAERRRRSCRCPSGRCRARRGPVTATGMAADLDGSRRSVAGGLDGRLHFCAETELSERLGFQKFQSPSAQPVCSGAVAPDYRSRAQGGYVPKRTSQWGCGSKNIKERANRSPALRHARVLAYITLGRKENRLFSVLSAARLCHRPAAKVCPRPREGRRHPCTAPIVLRPACVIRRAATCRTGRR